ncbi:MAG: hypothetical protein CL878_13630 [Dehalococcoidia bacterium]|nr:hypothetical protein [Dehalococcoidia bacterium]
MDSRERVATCLRHEEPDRVPIDFWATSEVTADLLDHFAVPDLEHLLQQLHVDFRYIDGPRYVGPSLTVRPDGTQEDHFGVPRQSVAYGQRHGSGTYQEVAAYPLADATSVDAVESYPKWPHPDWFDYAGVREQARRARETGKVVVFMGDRLNRCAQLKPAMYLRGAEQLFLDLIVAPEVAQAIFRRIADFYAEYSRRTLEAAAGDVDIFFTGDDFGTQDNTFISPAMWRQFLREGFTRFITIGHELGCQVAHHTCGSVRALLPDLVECGLDILNPVQPEVAGMDYQEIKAAFGDRLVFHGGISIQQTMPYGTPEEVRDEVKDRKEVLGPGGGYVFCTAHNIQPDTPLRNIEALFAACRDLGRYH